MCGLVGLISFSNNEKISSPIIKNMADEINHRGPDDEGFFINDWIGLGFKRLSIIDVSQNGHQPMSDTSNNFVIMMNGEIYNYK